MKIQLFSVLFLIGALRAEATPSFGDSAAAYATQTIVHRIQIKKVSDLNFGEASPGDGPKTVLPGLSENRENASFEVEGEPLRGYQIVLPARNSVKMILGSGGRDREINVKEFSSFPIRGAVLDRNGKGLILVGATRDAISSTQKAGSYVGQFFVTVVY